MFCLILRGVVLILRIFFSRVIRDVMYQYCNQLIISLIIRACDMPDVRLIGG